jgi:hypothetical protein
MPLRHGSCVLLNRLGNGRIELRSLAFQDPVHARPANAERLGDLRGTEALRLHLAHTWTAQQMMVRGGSTMPTALATKTGRSKLDR